MSKVRGPLFSISAHGTLGKALTYKKGLIGNVVRALVKPKINFTPAQEVQKTWFSRGVWTWRGVTGGYNYWYSGYCQGLQEPAREAWRRADRVNGLYGYYLFMKYWIERSLRGLPQYQTPPNFGFCVADEWLADDLICDGIFHSWGD